MMLEKNLAQFIVESRYEDLPEKTINITKNVILTVAGTTIAGATAEGCSAVFDQVKEWGGNKEATILVHGEKVPAHNAALVNGMMSRSLDFCDVLPPGLHIGSSSFPTALAAAELIGGCTGKEFLTALVVGTEVAVRLNLSDKEYNGFDPTGVCGIFATASIAGKLLYLDVNQQLNALALAFNRSSGSFQSNIDGSLAVRLIQGWTAQSGIVCAQLAQKGINGPHNFLEGVYGYFHLFARDKFDAQQVGGDLGTRFELEKTVFKLYPSCGGTLAGTDAILDIIRESDLLPEEVEQIEIRLTPYIYNLVGHNFKIGSNPKVDAQFSIQYCLADALLRRSSKLQHFDELSVKDPAIMPLIERIKVVADSGLNSRRDTAIEMKIVTKNRGILGKSVYIPRGFPERPLTKDEHHVHFQDCISYAKKKLPPRNIEKLVTYIEHLEDIDDVRKIIPLFLSE